MSDAGWRACIDHIIRPDSPCPVCRVEELEAALRKIVDSEYCADGYRNCSVSEDAMRMARKALEGE